MQHKQLVFGILLVVIFVLTGCLTPGQKRVQFTFENVSRLTLGQPMSEDDVEKLFGPINNPIPHYNNAGVWLVRTYGYVVDKLHNRWLWIELQGNTLEDLKLNGFQYISTHKEDFPRTDLQGKHKIRINHSTKNDLKRLLGEPNGKIICPTFIDPKLKRCKHLNEIWQYYLAECKADYKEDQIFNLILTQLSVSLNRAGTVVEVKTFEPEAIKGGCMPYFQESIALSTELRGHKGLREHNFQCLDFEGTKGIFISLTQQKRSLFRKEILKALKDETLVWSEDTVVIRTYE